MLLFCACLTQGASNLYIWNQIIDMSVVKCLWCVRVISVLGSGFPNLESLKLSTVSSRMDAMSSNFIKVDGKIVKKTGM